MHLHMASSSDAIRFAPQGSVAHGVCVCVCVVVSLCRFSPPGQFVVLLVTAHDNSRGPLCLGPIDKRLTLSLILCPTSVASYSTFGRVCRWVRTGGGVTKCERTRTDRDCRIICHPHKLCVIRHVHTHIHVTSGANGVLHNTMAGSMGLHVREILLMAYDMKHTDHPSESHPILPIQYIVRHNVFSSLASNRKSKHTTQHARDPQWQRAN